MHRWALLFAILGVAGPAAASPELPASGRYVCGDGSLAAIELEQSGIILRRDGATTRLAPGAAWSGVRFVAEGLELRGRGPSGHRELTIKARGAAELACKSVPPVAMAGIATGTAVYRARIALAPGAVLAVELRDTARADAPAPLLARTEVRPRGNQVPFHWRLDFDAKMLTPRARPALSARITDAGGKLIWISDTFTPLPVSATTAHAEAEIRLVPVGGSR